MASQAAQVRKLVSIACFHIGDRTDQVIRKRRNCNHRSRDSAYHLSLQLLRSIGLETLEGETVYSAGAKDASRFGIYLKERFYWRNVHCSPSGQTTLTATLTAKSRQR